MAKYKVNKGLRSFIEWGIYAKSGLRPHNIPSDPNRTYASGWKGHPDFFGYECNRSTVKTKEEWISIAEKLSEEHNGIPSAIWLKNNKLGGLDNYIRCNPELFDHLQQNKKSKTIEKWVEIAEKLAKEHEGALPYPQWLKNNGYQRLQNLIYKYPQKFEHIPQDRKSTPVKKWVSVAEEIAKNNQGVLPNGAYLRSHGFEALDKARYVYPHLFEHIKHFRYRKKY